MKPNHLLKHYGRYIPLYNEPPCVRCGKPAATIGQFLDHAKLHVSDSGESVAKNEYLPKRCAELREIRDGQLALEAAKINPPSKPANRRKRKRAENPVRSTSTTAISRDPLSPQPGSCTPSHQNAASSLDATALHHGSQILRLFPLSTELDPQANQTPESTNGAAVLQFEKSTYEFQPTPKDTHSGLPAGYVESGNHVTQPYIDFHMTTQHRNPLSPLESSRAIAQDTRSEENISQPNAGVNAQHINTLSRLEIGPFTNQGAGCDNNTAIEMMVHPMHPLPVQQQQATRYANMDMNSFVGPGTVYTDFSPVVGTLNFATQ
ncbi:hypothetical protein F4808DRAFT_259923 [Astrocystis sublimbata]|nr:hypothetical protein F4808DRAFT_259923 [Astrocystis sublimbata]